MNVQERGEEATKIKQAQTRKEEGQKFGYKDNTRMLLGSKPNLGCNPNYFSFLF